MSHDPRLPLLRALPIEEICLGVRFLDGAGSVGSDGQRPDPQGSVGWSMEATVGAGLEQSCSRPEGGTFVLHSMEPPYAGGNWWRWLTQMTCSFLLDPSPSVLCVPPGGYSMGEESSGVESRGLWYGIV